MNALVPSLGEIQRSLSGAWDLFLGRPQGLDKLDRSVEGFWRSFGVIVLLLPIHALSLWADARLRERDGSEGLGDPSSFDLVAEYARLGLDWIAFPALLAAFAGVLGIGATYVSYVVARNWAAPIGMTIALTPLVLEAVGVLPQGLGGLLFLIAVAVVLRYHFMILRIALKADLPLAIALLLTDLALSFLIFWALA